RDRQRPPAVIAGEQSRPLRPTGGAQRTERALKLGLHAHAVRIRARPQIAAQQTQADELAPAEPVDAPSIADLEVDADGLDRLLIEVRNADQRDVVDARVLLARVPTARDETAKVDAAVLVAAADHFPRRDLVDVVRDLDRVPVGRKAEALGPRRPVYDAEGLRHRLLGSDVRRSI